MSNIISKLSKKNRPNRKIRKQIFLNLKTQGINMDDLKKMAIDHINSNAEKYLSNENNKVNSSDPNPNFILDSQNGLVL